MDPEVRARRDLKDLRKNLYGLVALAEQAFPVKIGRRSHLRFMLASFAVKQSEHANSLLKLGPSPDTMLIARTMIEGLSQMLWAAKRPRHRPLLWRSFVFVHDWRQIQEHRAQGRPVDPQVERVVRVGLRRFGHRFLTRQAQDARAAGRALPDDPYMRNWYGERETEILRDVGGEDLLRQAYGPFSEWHHWRVGAIGRLVSFDEASGRFTMSTSRPSDVATATACAFQCLWQTMQLLNARCRLGMGRELLGLLHLQLKLAKHRSPRSWLCKTGGRCDR
jgi:hypothetical protein